MNDMQENMTRMLLVTDVQDIIKKHQAQIITSLKDPDIRYFFKLNFCEVSIFEICIWKIANFLLHIADYQQIFVWLRDSQSCPIYTFAILYVNYKCNYSIRRRALDLLYGMCDVTNAKDIVEELLQVKLMQLFFYYYFCLCSEFTKTFWLLSIFLLGFSVSQHSRVYHA